MKSRVAKISSLKPQVDNANKGSQYGDHLLEKSLQKFGFREAGTIDKNGSIISGNHRTEKAGEIGIEEAVIIEADPNKAYYLQFKDIDIDSKEGKELALALNATAKANIVWDVDVVSVMAEDVNVEEWGVSVSGNHFNPKGDEYDEDDEDEESGGNGYLAYTQRGGDKEYEQNVFPLAITVDKATQIKWQEYKKSVKIQNDSEAFRNLLKTI